MDEGKRGWWLPGGGVDGPETPLEGAQREAIEEAGVLVNEDDICLLQIEPGFQRLRYIFSGTAASDTLKTIPDKESEGARWMTRDETKELSKGKFPVSNSKLRGSEPLEFFRHCDEGKPEIPLRKDGPIQFIVDKETKGVQTDKRDMFFTVFTSVVVCQVAGTDEFVVNPSIPSQICLPSTPVDFKHFGVDMATSAIEMLEDMGIIEPKLEGISAIRDWRKKSNELDFRVAYIVRIDKKGKLKTAKASEFTDPFDVQAIEWFLKEKTLLPLSIIGHE